jgi:hypothetical protein
MGEVSTIGLDIAKSVFQVHGVDDSGAIVIRKRISRAKMLEFFGKLSPCLVGIEACPSACFSSESAHEPASDIDTVPVDRLKALDPNRPIREADMKLASTVFNKVGLRYLSWPWRRECNCKQNSLLVVRSALPTRRVAGGRGIGGPQAMGAAVAAIVAGVEAGQFITSAG